VFDALPPASPPQPIIVVTGAALPDPASERAYSADVLDRQKLIDSPATRLDALLTGLPGVQNFRRSGADTAHPTSQGVTLRALGGNAASRVLLVLDGVPQADPFGGWINWPAYDPAGLQEVRVVRGGGSVGYGPGALGGAIDMRSYAGAAMMASIEAGSRQSLDGHFYAGTRFGAGLAMLNVQAARSAGFIPITAGTRGPVDMRSPYREGSARGRLVVPLGGDVELQLGGLAFADRRERGVPFTENRTRGFDGSVRLVGSGRWQWTGLAYAQWRDLESSFANVNATRESASRVSLQHVPSNGWGASFEVRPPVAGIDLRAGADLRFTQGESRELFAFVGGGPTRHRLAGGQSGTQGLFAEVSVSQGPLTFSGGVRLDRWRISQGELVERPLAGGPPTRDERYPARSGWRPTARLGLVAEVTSETSLRAAAYRGWRLPTLNELFRPFRAGADATAANAFLDPEQLFGAEAGIDYRTRRVDLSLTAFVNRLSNAIANVTLGHGPGMFPGVGFVAGDYRQRQNLDAILVKGIEGSAEIRRGPWSMELGASLTGARVHANGPAANLDGLRPAQTPRLAMSAGLGWEQSRRAAKIVVRHTGPQYEDDLNRQRLPPATTLDAFGAWPLTDRIQLVVRGQNLLDETVFAGISDDGTVERGTPRSFWLGLRFRP
jgi:vitamin B12 transporter